MSCCVFHHHVHVMTTCRHINILLLTPSSSVTYFGVGGKVVKLKTPVSGGLNTKSSMYASGFLRDAVYLM